MWPHTYCQESTAQRWQCTIVTVVMGSVWAGAGDGQGCDNTNNISLHCEVCAHRVLGACKLLAIHQRI